MRETWVWPLGREDPLEKEMAAHSNILTWKIPWTEEPGRLQSMGSQRVGHDWVTSLSLSTKVHLVKAMIFPVVMYGCESWTIKKAEHWRIADFELWCWRKLLRVPWTARRSKEVQGLQEVHPKGNQSWIFIGRTEDEAETPIPWPPDAKNWLIWKDPDSGKDWRQEEKGTTENEMVGWHHQLNGHEFEWTPRIGDGQGRPGVLQSMGSQRVRHDWVTELD